MRQQGAEPSSPSPSQAGAKTLRELPKRGQIWPASVNLIALPTVGSNPTPMAVFSERCAEFLLNPVERMLVEQPILDDVLAEIRLGKSVPYVDPEIRAGIFDLAKRMAKARMLQGLPQAKAEVGLFTVIKKAWLDPVEGIQLTLRLVFDERVPNKLWRAPPWVALAGPGALAGIDLSSAAEQGATMEWLTGDLPNYYFCLELPPWFAQWFALPDVSLEDLCLALDAENESEIAACLRKEGKGAKQARVGVKVPVMGWNWAVFLAQSFLLDQVLLPQRLSETRLLIEGAPTPQLSRENPYAVFVYIDDFGLGRLIFEEADRTELSDMAADLKSRLRRLGLDVHKEEQGLQINPLGHQVGGSPCIVVAAAEKQWIAAEALWHLARSGRARPVQVESLAALATWIAMTNRGALSVLDTTYGWVRENREKKKVLQIPREVRRELAALAALLPVIEQNLEAPWCTRVLMMDASDLGGGICETDASLDQLKKEARWAVRGHWLTYAGEEFLHQTWQGELPQGSAGHLSVEVAVHRGIAPKIFFFHHFFSGLRRVGDLEWHLVRQGGAKGLKIIVFNYDLAYGPEFDLERPEVLERILEQIERGEGERGHNGAPCSTCSRARFVPGGPPPLRTREWPWGRPGLSKKDQDHVDTHSRLMKNGLEGLRAIARKGGAGLNEHPEDPGRPPFPSIYATAFYAHFEKASNFERVTFPQCALGACSRKPTTWEAARS